MRLLRRLVQWVRLRRLDTDLAEEMEFHREKMLRELMDGGMPPGEANALIAREFGNGTVAREDARGVWFPPALESLVQDLTYAMRNLRRQPVFTLVALLTLAVAIGMNTSLFTVFQAAALKPWPVRDAARMVTIHATPANQPEGSRGVSGLPVSEIRFLNVHSRAFDGIFVMREEGVRLESDPPGKSSSAVMVSGNYFRVLGVEMERGRGFLDEEDRPGAPASTVVLSYAAWHSRFAGDPEITGRKIRIDNVPFTVIGVASRDFSGTVGLKTDMWIPLVDWPVLRPLDRSAMELLTSLDYCCSHAGGRLAPGVTRDQARAELSMLSQRFHAEAGKPPNGILLASTPILSQPGSKSDIGTLFILMFTGVGLVLLLACANVGNLLLARAAARQREIATRLSLGASRLRVVRQLLTESLVLALLSGLIGIAMAMVLPSYVLSRATGEALNLHLTPDWTVLCFSVLTSVGACLAFGLAPALHATGVNIIGGLKERGLASRLTLRSVLLTIQVIVSVVLLVSAGMMIRGVQKARTIDVGFSVGALTVVSFDLPANVYTPARTQSLVEDLDRSLDGLPQSGPRCYTRSTPFANGHWFTNFSRSSTAGELSRMIEFEEVSADCFRVLNLPLAAGRGLERADAGRAVIVVNEAMVRKHFAGEPAVGKTIVMNDKAVEIVGVVKDARIVDLGPVEPLVFQPLRYQSMPHLLVSGAAPGYAQQIDGLAKRLEPRMETRVEPLGAALDRTIAPAQVGAALASALGFLALALASIGIFGVVAYLVRQRTQEIGLRIALGATQRQIAGLLYRSISRAMVTGLIVGLLLTVAASGLIKKFVFGLPALDPSTFGAVCLVLFAAAMAATWIPVRRACGIDPVRALHHE